MRTCKLFKRIEFYLMIIVCCAATANAQEAPTLDAGKKAEVPPDKLLLTAQPAPEPRLKYLLLPPLIAQRTGNAAVYYGKIKSEQNSFFTSKEVAKLIATAQTETLSELRANPAYDQLINLGPIYTNMRLGACSTMVDWQLPLREVFFTDLLLPEIQESQQFIRILYARARIQIARGDYAGAIETVQTGIAMGRHVGQGPTLINGLVGMLAVDTMLAAVQEMIAEPTAPNLYWALAELPSTLVDLQACFEAERYLLYYTEKGWLQPERLQGDEHFWRGELNRLWGYISDTRSDQVPAAKDPKLALYVVQGYPASKERLVARGFKLEEVEQMPVAKVIMLDALHQYNCNVDATMTEARQALLEPTRLDQLRLENSTRVPEALPVSKNLGLGTMHSVLHTVLRNERRRAALQAVEAIRLSAAESGKLPERLHDVTKVYVPLDPSSGLPFTYERTHEGATLSSTKIVPELKLELSLRAE